MLLHKSALDESVGYFFELTGVFLINIGRQKVIIDSKTPGPGAKHHRPVYRAVHCTCIISESAKQPANTCIEYSYLSYVHLFIDIHQTYRYGQNIYIKQQTLRQLHNNWL